VIKRNPAASPQNAKRKDVPMSVNKVISLSKRAEDEEKPFFEQLLQEGRAQASAGGDRKLLVQESDIKLIAKQIYAPKED